MLVAERLAWQRDGACVVDRGPWDDPDLAPLAVHMCRTHCPVLEKCRAWAAERDDWDAVVVAGTHWGTRHRGGPTVVDERPHLCDDCIGARCCVICGVSIVHRMPQARTCSVDCGKALAARRERRRSRPHRRHCRVCRSSIPASSPARQQVCAKEQCGEVWRARQSRAATAAARLRDRVVSA